jgi:hypothetical protein
MAALLLLAGTRISGSCSHGMSGALAVCHGFEDHHHIATPVTRLWLHQSLHHTIAVTTITATMNVRPLFGWDCMPAIHAQSIGAEMMIWDVKIDMKVLN